MPSNSTISRPTATVESILAMSHLGAVKVATTPAQLNPNQPLLQCIQTLKTLLINNGVDETGYWMLYRMIEMMTAMGWEAHVMVDNYHTHDRPKMNVSWYVNCISEGCMVFQQNISDGALKRAVDAWENLPAIDRDDDGLMKKKLKQWKKKLDTLHDPNGNDAELFKQILDHYDEVAHQRLIQLSILKPEYKLEQVVERAKEVYIQLADLRGIAQRADALVRQLEEKLKLATRLFARDSIMRGPKNPKQLTIVRSTEILHPTVYQPPIEEKRSTPKAIYSKSFSVAEEAIARRDLEAVSRRGLARAATLADAWNQTSSAIIESAVAKAKYSFHGTSLGGRGDGIEEPRVFTGSFSQLEDDLRNLQLHKVKTPEGQDTASDEETKVRDFADSSSTSPSPSPRPVTLLCRREAVISRDAEMRDRFINGEVVTSRRPSTRGRSQTIDEPRGGLEAWLGQKRV